MLSVRNINKKPNQLPIQCIIYHRRRTCFFKLNYRKEGSLAWLAIFHVELVQKIQSIFGLMYYDSMLGLSRLETQELAQQSQICHRKCMVHSILQGGNFFLWYSYNQKVIHIQENNNKITMNQLQINIYIRLASNKTQWQQKAINLGIPSPGGFL